MANEHLDVHHMALGAMEVEVVARFYREMFGLPELTRHHLEDGTVRSIWLDCKTFVLMIEAIESTEPEIQMRSGLFLIAFSVSPEQRKSVEDRLISRGHTIEQRSGFSSYTRDPEGNRVAISALDVKDYLSHEERT